MAVGVGDIRPPDPQVVDCLNPDGEQNWGAFVGAVNQWIIDPNRNREAGRQLRAISTDFFLRARKLSDQQQVDLMDRGVPAALKRFNQFCQQNPEVLAEDEPAAMERGENCEPRPQRSIGTVICDGLKALVLSVWHAVRAVLKFFFPCCFRESAPAQNPPAAVQEPQEEAAHSVVEEPQEEAAHSVVEEPQVYVLQAKGLQLLGNFSGDTQERVDPRMLSATGLQALWLQLEQGHVLTQEEASRFINSIFGRARTHDNTDLIRKNDITLNSFFTGNALKGAFATNVEGEGFFVLFDGRNLRSLVYVDCLATQRTIQVKSPRDATTMLKDYRLTLVTLKQ